MTCIIMMDPDELTATAGVLRQAAGQLDELAGQIYAACCTCCATPGVDASIADLGAWVRSSVGSVEGGLRADAAGLVTSASVIANDSSLATTVSAAWVDGVLVQRTAGGYGQSITGGQPGNIGLGGDLLIGGVPVGTTGGYGQSITGGQPGNIGLGGDLLIGGVPVGTTGGYGQSVTGSAYLGEGLLGSSSPEVITTFYNSGGLGPDFTPEMAAQQAQSDAAFIARMNNALAAPAGPNVVLPLLNQDANHVLFQLGAQMNRGVTNHQLDDGLIPTYRQVPTF